MSATSETYNCCHDIFELFYILLNLPLAKTGTERGY